MKPSSFEKDLLIKYFEEKQIDIELLKKSINKIRLQSREYSPIGCFTTFKNIDCLKVTEGKQSGIWGEIGANINKEKIYTEFEYHIKNDYLYMIEGFTYGGKLWPKRIKSYEIFKIDVQYIKDGKIVEGGEIEGNITD